MKRGRYSAYIIVLAVCAVIGTFFKVALLGYSFMAYGFWGVAALAAVLLALAVINDKKTGAQKTVKTLRHIIYYCVSFFCIVLAVTEFIIASDAKTDAVGEDYVIVLGAGVNGTTPSATLSWRLRAALDYLNEHPDAACILSGGQGPGENITEAECMYRWLVNSGVDGNRLYKEEKSTSTEENLKFSTAIIDELSGGKQYTVAIVSSDFHLCRAKTMAYDLGLEAKGVSAKTVYPVLRVNYYFREAFAMWWMMVS